MQETAPPCWGSAALLELGPRPLTSANRTDAERQECSVPCPSSMPPQLTEGVVVQVQYAELRAVSHCNGEASPAFACDAWVGAQRQLFEAWRRERSQTRALGSPKQSQAN